MLTVSVISGGTATNSMVQMLEQLSSSISYIMPISDNGGSTSEIIRVVGGPAIGDIRSRCTRIIPTDPPISNNLRDLLCHRLPEDEVDAQAEWSQIVNGTHPRWIDIPSHYREMVRPFFIKVGAEFLKRSRPGREFVYSSASIGNLFLTGARLFTGSLESAVEMMLRITHVSHDTEVLPALNTNFMHHIAALLQNDTVIYGQSQISHPEEPSIDSLSVEADPEMVPTTAPLGYGKPRSGSIDGEDAHMPFTHPDLTNSQLNFSKNYQVPLESPIRRVFYINPFGLEIHPKASTRVQRALAESNCVIYSIGSLYTSLIPVLLLRGVADSIETELESGQTKTKVMLLNGSPDRETSGMSPIDHVEAVIKACLYSKLQRECTPQEIFGCNWTRFLTHVLSPYELSAKCLKELRDHNIGVIQMTQKVVDEDGKPIYDQKALLRELTELNKCTHK